MFRKIDTADRAEQQSIMWKAIRAGIDKVLNKFGHKNTQKDESFDILDYSNTDDYANFFFKNNKSVKISW